jgi:hypothetical protein
MNYLTVSEIFNKAEVSKMNNALCEIKQWSATNFLNTNVSQIKETRLSSLIPACIEPLKLKDTEI